jgi:hypothetical protein
LSAPLLLKLMVEECRSFYIPIKSEVKWPSTREISWKTDAEGGACFSLPTGRKAGVFRPCQAPVPLAKQTTKGDGDGLSYQARRLSAGSVHLCTRPFLPLNAFRLASKWQGNLTPGPKEFR